MSASITVYTSLTADADQLREDQCTSGASLVAFVDRPPNQSVWSAVPAYDRFKSSRRNSRAPKILCHQFISSDYSIWMDARIALKTNASALIDHWLADADLAVFAHPKRGCLYSEAQECLRQELDKPEYIAGQVAKYQGDGFPENAGLAECGIIFRRHSRDVARFNDCWWSEYCRHSVRDQISFMYAVRAAGLRVNYIPSAMRELHFDLFPRGARREM